MTSDILSILQTKKDYQRYNRFIKPYIYTKEVQDIIKLIPVYYDQFNTDHIDWSEFEEWYLTANQIDKLLVDGYKKIFSDLKNVSSPSSAMRKHILSSLVLQDSFRRIREVSDEGELGSSKVSIDDVRHIISEYETQVGKISIVDTLFDKTDIADIIAGQKTKRGFTWRLEELNQAVGEVHKGDLIIIGARPDGGKTAFLCSEVSHMIPQLPQGKKCLWFDLEQTSSVVRPRIMSAYFGVEYTEICKDPTKYIPDYKMHIENRLLYSDRPVVTTDEIESVLETEDVGLIVIDQMRKVRGFESKNGQDFVRLEHLYIWAREIAKQYAPVITVHQADGSAEGMEYITQEKLYGSKTSLQGEADVIITIGRSHASNNNTRFIYVAKNKKMGNNKRLRNGKFQVEIQPEISRFKGTF